MRGTSKRCRCCTAACQGRARVHCGRAMVHCGNVHIAPQHAIGEPRQQQSYSVPAPPFERNRQGIYENLMHGIRIFLSIIPDRTVDHEIVISCSGRLESSWNELSTTSVTSWLLWCWPHRNRQKGDHRHWSVRPKKTLVPINTSKSPYEQDKTVVYINLLEKNSHMQPVMISTDYVDFKRKWHTGQMLGVFT